MLASVYKPPNGMARQSERSEYPLDAVVGLLIFLGVDFHEIVNITD